MTGCVGNATPAAAVADGWVWITNLLAGAALTTIALDVTDFRMPLLNVSVIVPALLSARLTKFATPPESITVVVPWSGPVPLARTTSTSVLSSPISRLPYWSSSSITGCVKNAVPAVALDDGSVSSTS